MYGVFKLSTINKGGLTLKVIFNNKKELIINYFSVADGQMLIKTDFVSQTELENLFKDFLGTKIITYKDDKEEKQYSNYTNFDSITRNIKTDEYTIIMSLDGSDFTSQIEALKNITNNNINLLKSMQNLVDEITVSSEKQGQKMQEIQGFLNTLNDEVGTGKENMTNISLDIENLHTSDTNIKEEVNSANSQITDLQLAMVEIYEGMGVTVKTK